MLCPAAAGFSSRSRRVLLAATAAAATPPSSSAPAGTGRPLLGCPARGVATGTPEDRPLRDLRFGIVGGGISGLGIANALLRRGFQNVSVFDKSGSSSASSRSKGAIYIPANGVRVLDAWECREGLSHQTLQQTGTQATNGRVILATDQQEMCRNELKDIREGKIPDSPPVCLSRHALLQRLERSAQERGAKIEFQRNLKRVEIGSEDEDHEVSLGFEDGTSHTCDLLIAADGNYSTIRASFFDAAPLTNTSQWWVSGTTASKDGWDGRDDVCFECRGTGTRLWATGIGNGRIGWRGVMYGGNRGSELQQLSDSSGVQKLLDSFRPAPSYMLNAVKNTSAKDIGFGVVEVHEPRSEWSKFNGKLVLVGSAAHGIPDALHQDVCMSLESCEALAISLQHSCERFGPDSNMCEVELDALRFAAKTYQDSRFPRVKKIYADSVQDQLMLNTSSSIMAGLRSTAEWMNQFSHDLQDKELVAYDIFASFGDTARRTL